MVAELNEIWGIEDKCDKIMDHIKNCPECQKKLKKSFEPQQVEPRQKIEQVIENFQVEPNKFQIEPRQKRQLIKEKEKEIDLIEKLFEYSDIILIGLTIYLILKAL